MNQESTPNEPRPLLCIGHRGAMGHAPENTLSSIQKALDLGVDWIEVDVFHVEDELIVIHDDRLERTTNGHGDVMTQSLAYLRSLDAGDGQQIPTLGEVFALIDRRVGVNIELKGPGTAVPVVHFVESQVAQGWQYDRILVSSFDHQMLRVVRQLNPHIRLGALVFEMPPGRARFGQVLGAYSVNPWFRTVTREFVQDAHARGLKVYVYTVNEPEDIAHMRRLRVDGIFTNYPERVLGSG